MNEKKIKSAKRKKILFTCLGVSCALHLVALFVFYKRPPSYKNHLSSLLTRLLNDQEETFVPLDKDELLEEVFADFESPSTQFLPPFDQEKSTLQAKMVPLMETVQPTSLGPLPLIQVAAESLPPQIIEDTHEPITNTLVEVPFQSTFPPLAIQKVLTLKPHLFAVDLEEFQDESLSHYASSLEIPDQANTIGQRHGLSSSLEYVLHTPTHTPSSEVVTEEQSDLPPHPLMVFRSFQDPVANWEPVLKPTPSLKEISNYALPDTITTIDWGSHFNIETKVAADPSGEGYLFAISLSPKSDLTSKKMKQNFTFFIDRSNSIDKHYYEALKKAVYRTLSFIPEGDTFNIVVFDRKITRLSDRPLPISKSSIHYAKKFLAAQDAGGFFSATEIYPMIEKALPSHCPDQDMNVAFVLTDGNTLLNLKKQQKALQKIIEKNNGKWAIHTAAAGISNNIVLLDLLSTCNRGSFFYSRTYASFPRKFVSAVTRLKNPLLKDISIKSDSDDPNATIELYPSNYSAPALYQGEPYVILGKTPSLSSFNLAIEGRNGDQWVTISKVISLKDAKKNQGDLEKKWSLQKARNSYEAFLKNPKKTHLTEAKQILQTCSEYTFQ